MDTRFFECILLIFAFYFTAGLISLDIYFLIKHNLIIFTTLFTAYRLFKYFLKYIER